MPARVAIQRVLRRARLITPATWDATDASLRGFTLTNSDKTSEKTSVTSWKAIRSTTSKASGKWYVELKCTTAATGSAVQWGFCNAGFSSANYLGSAASSAGVQPDGSFNGVDFTQANAANPTAGNPALNKIYGLALDMNVGKAWFANDNTFVGDPAAGTGEWLTFTPGTTGALHFAMAVNSNTGGAWTLQAASGEQTYTPPSGFTAWG